MSAPIYRDFAIRREFDSSWVLLHR